MERAGASSGTPPPPKGVSKSEAQIRDRILLGAGFGGAGSGMGCEVTQNSGTLRGSTSAPWVGRERRVSGAKRGIA
jgi:hypothetical protein